MPIVRRLAPAALAACGVVLLLYAFVAFRALPQMLDIHRECRMSYMFPRYFDHTDEVKKYASSSQPALRRYKLYNYREGNFIAPGRTAEIRRSAVPALFIPGNAGSYGQVRSLASSTLQQYWDPDEHYPWPEFVRSRGPVEWWTIDFNEDFSALSGRILEDQAWYVNEVIRYLRTIYVVPGNNMYMSGEQNMSITLLGHSMGGIAARLALQMPNYTPGSVDTIVTLATPHAFPPVSFDRSIESVYSRVNKPADTPLPLIVSLAGGLLDVQLSSDASSLSLGRLHHPDARLSSYTASVASLWSGIDHIAVVWCDQLRTRIARALLLDVLFFDMEASARAQPHMIQQRRSLWRTILGLPLEATSPREHMAALEASSAGPMEMRFMSNPQVTYLRGPHGITNTSDGSTITYVLSSPGPGYRHDIDPAEAEASEAVAFELVTNMTPGPSILSKTTVAQQFELYVLACANVPMAHQPFDEELVKCSIVHPNSYSILPFSPRDAVLKGWQEKFPNRSYIYDAPTKSLRRLHISADYIRAHGIEFFRIQKARADAAAASAHGDATILQGGWLVDRPPVLHGAPHWWLSHSWALRQPPSLADATTPAPLREWLLRDVDSSLLAYTLELRASKCAGTRNEKDINFAPMLRATNLATGDSRIFPSLPLGNVQLPLMLHGSAPFMPPGYPLHRGTLIQLWVPQAFDHACPQPYDELRLKVHRRASIALLVLRYRVVLIVWPIAVLALARILHPTEHPTAALISLLQPLGAAILFGTPVAIHLLACLAYAIGLGTRWYNVGIGLLDLRAVFIGPVLVLMSYGGALAVSALTGVVLALAARLARPLTGHMVWTRRSLAIFAASLFVACALFPYQLFVAASIAAYAYITVRSAASSRSALADSPASVAHREREWHMVFFVWILPLTLPTVVAWFRAGCGIWGAYLVGIVVRMCASAGFVAIALTHWSDIQTPSAPWIATATRACYGALAAGIAFYGARYAFIAYDLLLLTLYWELALRFIPQKESEEYELLNDPFAAYSNVPDALEPPLPSSIAASIIPTSTSSRPSGNAPDDLIMEYLHTLDAYAEARSRSSASLSNAFQQLARARIVLGNAGTHLGRCLYDERMTPQVHIGQNLELVRQVPPAPPAPPRKSENESGLRRRKGELKEDTPDDAPPQEPAGYDPLRQFSALPPASLRNAQRQFIDALEHLSSAKGVLALKVKLASMEDAIRAARAVA